MKKILLFVSITLLNLNFLFSQTQIGTDIDGVVAGDLLGTAVALNTDASQLAISVPGFTLSNGDNVGRIYLYDITNGSVNAQNFSLQGTINGTNFGAHLDFIGSNMNNQQVLLFSSPRENTNGPLKGSVSVVFSGNAGWGSPSILTYGENDYDGVSAISLSKNGSLAAVASYANNANGIGSNTGHVRVFNITGSQKGSDIDGIESGESFGTSVDLSEDGSIVAAGGIFNNTNGTQSGVARVYYYDAASIQPGWYLKGSEINGQNAREFFGQSVALSNDGNTLAVGATGTGTPNGLVRIYSFNSANNNWEQIGNDLIGENVNHGFGQKVKISDDGSLVLISAPRNNNTGAGVGAVYLYKNVNETWVKQGNTLFGENNGDKFGESIGISNNGNKVVVGSRFNTNGTGSVRVFNYSSVLSNNDYLLEKNTKIYPIPTKGIINIINKSFNNVKVKVLDINGSVIKTVFIEDNKIDISSLSAGNYILMINYNGRQLAKKVILN